MVVMGSLILYLCLKYIICLCLDILRGLFENLIEQSCLRQSAYVSILILSTGGQQEEFRGHPTYCPKVRLPMKKIMAAKFDVTW